MCTHTPHRDPRGTNGRSRGTPKSTYKPPWHKLLHRQDGGRKRADLAAVITLRHHTLGIPHGMRLKLGAQDVIAPSSSSARNVRSCTALLRHRWRFLCRVGKRTLAEVDHSGHFAKEVPFNRARSIFSSRSKGLGFYLLNTRIPYPLLPLPPLPPLLAPSTPAPVLKFYGLKLPRNL
jgi:hypothetical protein